LGQMSGWLSAARDEGIARFAEIAQLVSPGIGVPEAQCLAYLRDNLEFHLGPRQRAGLERFAELAARNGLVPQSVGYASA
jgi:chorismate dehydratase